MTDWGLSHVSVQKHFRILDVGFGGGRTISKLAALATEGKVVGVDFSAASIAVARKTNKQWISSGRVEIREGSVSQLPFAAASFDLVVAIETHFWWPDLPGDFREVFRVLKPGGELAVVAEIYKGATIKSAKHLEKILPTLGMKLLSPDEHRDLLTGAGYSNVQITLEPARGWIFVSGKKSEAA